MSAPTLDRPPGSSQSGSSSGRRRRTTLLVIGALVVLAAAVGTSLAYATRPMARQEPAVAGPTPSVSSADQPAADQEQTSKPEQPATPTSAPAAAGGQAPVLDDGNHDAYITKVDSANDRIVVDVVQVFHDDKAVEAAVADGKSPADAKYLTTWVRNQNPRLRTLPLADNLVVKLRDACGEPAGGRGALLAKLAENASQKGTYYYTLTVADGSVTRIQEKLAVNAC